MKLKPCAVILGRFQPFHKGHTDLVNTALKKDSSLPLIVLMIHSESNPKTVLPKKLTHTIIADSLENCSNINYNINEYYIVEANDWNEGVEKINKLGFEPIVWSVGPDRRNNLKRYIKDYVSEDAIVTGPREKVAAASSIRKAVEEDDYELFREMMCEGANDEDIFELLKKYIKKEK